MAYLGDKSVGDIVKIRENGTAVNYIIVHKGKPSDMYDDSCDGIWVLREEIHSNQVLDSTDNDYENSDMHAYLNGTFLNLFDSDIKAAIKQAKIPYRNGTGSGGSIASGSSGLSAKIFLLSGYEVGFTTSDYSYFPVDGAKLSYFESGNGTSAKNKRVAKYNGSAAWWWFRSPKTNGSASVMYANTDGGYNSYNYNNSGGVRPALILNSSLLVSDSGVVIVNSPPEITSDKASGTDLGEQTTAIDFTYKVDDADKDTTTVREYLDDVLQREFTATLGSENKFAATKDVDGFRKILNGSHTIKVTATDTQNNSTTHTLTFSKNITELDIKLKNPITADERISAVMVTLVGSIPADAVWTVEVTNNANDAEPVWENCTQKAKYGFGYAFKNTVAENGFALNIHVKLSRGASGSGGYITSISGGFE